MFLHHLHFGLVDRITLSDTTSFFDVALVESLVFLDYQIYAIKFAKNK